MTWHPYGPAVLLRGSCLTLLPVLAASGWRWHAAVGDPPYGLDFLGHAWDRGDGCVAHDPATWRALASCGLPGAHALMMHHGTTYHRMASAMEAAGFVPRHLIPWLYATGRCQAQRVMEPREVDGKRTMVTPEELEGLAPLLAPGCEPAFLGRLPLEAGCSVVQNLRRHGTGALRVAAVRSAVSDEDKARLAAAGGWAAAGYDSEARRNAFSGSNPPTTGAGYAEGGRYPKDVVHDGSPEVLAVFDRQGTRYSRKREEGNVDNAAPSFRKEYGGGPRKKIEASSGSGARYFPEVKLDGDEDDAWRYEPKPKGGAREVSGGHPTPKPLPLVRWQVRMLTCFPGQWVVDPFLGSGTTMRAALDEGMQALGIELDEVTAGGVTVCTGYCATVARRCPEVHQHVVRRAHEEMGLQISIAVGDGIYVHPQTNAALVVVREPAGEATCRDAIGKALGLTLDEHRVQLHRAHIEVDLAEGAPPDLADRLAELAGWPEVQALLCRRGDLVDPSQ